ncbi:bifunctional 2-polyprenyl-6-hydroxyphenol methylase/3-demethylubiquinol 3-O-methyltransferase UbiG [Inquilinus limosus]|uniref:Ubiquinone biosynthesis O-methyltransferase n=1 Tax=Inquilinus limosus MP06 TaxID=1398085 RepID=A0A0A0D7Y9_9PROT|nr:bifunctional 2-polyprenyl-6-hydroxyphenol methylase/3-demethylubiquinol 3-O-methyltransferase UbiG [Inquilinus limosus]KGM34796.1 3-demethylubiquinone-9 3-methyltransferase [Inquilinus limosus MP06]
MAQSPAATIDSAEIARFESMAADWWDPDGKFRPLHRMNPLRIGYIRDRVCARLDCDPLAPRPLAGLSILDIGCGGGLLSEPMARLGATVTGVDAGAEAVGVARAHAAESGLAIDYRCSSAEDLAASGARFDAVLALEIVEHVADVDAFCAALAALLRPGGTLVMSTLNRTRRSWAVAILGAEHLLRIIPRGTHEWRKFLKPHELAAALRRAGLGVGDIAGMVPDLRGGGWRLAPHHLGVNYILTAAKPE